MKKNTDELKKALSDSLDLSSFLKDQSDELLLRNIGAELEKLRREKGISKAALARRAGMSEYYLYQILKDRRKPSRDTLLCLCLGLSCTSEETQNLLRLCGYADLYVRIRRDAAFLYAFQENWDYSRLNDALYEMGEPLINQAGK